VRRVPLACVLLLASLLAAAPVDAVAMRSSRVSLSIVDRIAGSGQVTATSTTIGRDGLALISYQDAAEGDLKVAHCRTVACRSARTTVLDSDGEVGRWSSVAIGGDGRGLVAYDDVTTGTVKVAHCANVVCSAATTTTIGTGDGRVSLAVGPDGRGLVAFEDGGAIKVAHCSNVTCSSATTTTVASALGAPRPSIAIGSDGLGLISYVDRTEDERLGVNVAHCADTVCSSATTATVIPGLMRFTTSIAVGADGLALIAAADIDSNLYVAHCADLQCAAATVSFAGVSFASGASIVAGADGLGLTALVQGDAQGLLTTHCSDTACSTSTSTRIDPSPSVDQGLPSLAIGRDRFPLISYYDGLSLKVAHCSDVACAGSA
jgi:hypothetical protein